MSAPQPAQSAESRAGEPTVDEPLLRIPDSGRRLRSPEFYTARATVQRQMANEALALARQHELAAAGYRRRHDKLIEHAELMEQWAAEAAPEIDGLEPSEKMEP